MPDVLNAYGDVRIPTAAAQGADIATQRADDLDQFALEHISEYVQRALACAEPPPAAVDVGSASGGQALRLLAAGAQVTALDQDNYAPAFFRAARERGLDLTRCDFIQANICGFNMRDRLGLLDAIVCQRMIHYLPYWVALAVVSGFRKALKPNGRLYLSASGLDSELGEDYGGREAQVTDRFTPLSDAMRTKHGIHGDVCLYNQDDLVTLLTQAGLKVRTCFVSPFGNVKAVASLPTAI